MSLAKWVAIYVVQAVFWVWLAREAGRDRPRAPSRLSESLWRYDANVTRSFAWQALVFTTIGFLILLAYAATH